MASSIVIDLLMKTGSFETDSKRAEKRMAAFKKELASNAKAIGAAFVAGGALVTAAITSMINAGRDLVDDQAKLAQQLNTTYDSIETLSRAGELAGISLERIGAAGRQLEINLGKAARGTGAQADALEQLGISAEDLVGLPLDDKIAAINQALLENVDAAERAAVAADLFGENAAALALLNGDTIAQAARETRLFGLALSDVDAAQVELANDALATFETAQKGLQVQLARYFAPILQGIGDEFLEWAEKSGTMEQAVIDSMDRLIQVTGFLADALAGVGRTVSVLTDGWIIGINSVIAYYGRLATIVSELADFIPGVDTSGVTARIRKEFEQADAVIGQAWESIQETLLEPLPSDRLADWVDEVRRQSREAAEAAVEGRSAGLGLITEIDTSAFPERRVLEDAGAGAEAGGGGDPAAGLREDLASIVDETERFQMDLASGTERIIADSLVGGFDDGAAGIARSFQNLLAQLAADALAANIAGLIFGGTGGPAGPLSFLGGIFGGGRATGGPVSAGVTYRVNELEPEYFRPNTSGQVVPLSKTGGAMGTSLTQHIHVPLAFPAELEAYVRNVAGPAGRDAAIDVLNASRGRF